MDKLDFYQDVALDAARSAAGVALAFVRDQRPLDVTTKIDHTDFLTAADKAAEASAFEVFARRTPDVGVIGEESGGERRDLTWVIDPIDGTSNYVHGFRWCVASNVCLMDADGPLVSALVAPFIGEEWTATQGGGAYWNGRRLDITGGLAKRLSCGDNHAYKERLPHMKAAFDICIRHFGEVRRIGSTAIDLAMVASGVFAGYYGVSQSQWDIAPGILMIREAGGVATDWDGDGEAPLVSGDLIAGCPDWHRQMLGELKSVVREPRAAKTGRADPTGGDGQ